MHVRALALVNLINVLNADESASSRYSTTAAPVSVAERRYYREEVRSMFMHAYDSYSAHGWASDVLAPISCQGEDGWGGIALTLLDTLDTLAIMNNASEFERGVRYCVEQLSFDKDETVSLFETNIRALGGLLSAHVFASGAMLAQAPFTDLILPHIHRFFPHLPPHYSLLTFDFLQTHNSVSSPLLTPRVPWRDQTLMLLDRAAPFANDGLFSLQLCSYLRLPIMLLSSFAGYSGTHGFGLLPLARDLGERLLPALETESGIPYGSINLRRYEGCRLIHHPAALNRQLPLPSPYHSSIHSSLSPRLSIHHLLRGVAHNESLVACTAAAGDRAVLPLRSTRVAFLPLSA